MEIKGFDYDGVVSLGITPGMNDIIITGRCLDEAPQIQKELGFRCIKNVVFFNPITLRKRGNHTVEARTLSGMHKARTIAQLREGGIRITNFFEDDDIQAKLIKDLNPDVNVVMVISNDLVKL